MTTVPATADRSLDQQRNTRRLAQSTLVVMIAFGIAKAISLVQTVIIAQVFGVGSEWDAFVTANRIPEQIFILISGGALANAFIPVFSGYLATGKTQRAWKIATHVINTLFLTTLAVSALAFIAAPWLVNQVVAPGFDAATAAQTVELMRILLVSTLIFSVSGICMGILNSHNHFLLPALAPIMFDLGILFGVIFLIGPFGTAGIAYGAVLGAAMHLGIQVPGLIHFRARWWPELGLRDEELWHVIRLMIPRVLGLGVFNFNLLIMNNIGSRLGEGSVSALDWGWRLMQIPQTLIGTAMGIVIFPTLAALSEMGDESGKRDAMSGALRFILIASIPAGVGLIVIGQTLISLLERGAFDASASALVYSTLSAFTLGLIVHSVLEVVARSFYADKDTVTPLYAALVGAGVNLVLAYVLSGVFAVQDAALYNAVASTIPYFEPVTGNVAGLALANSIGVFFEVIILLVLLRSRWHGIQENTLVMTLLKTIVASLIMAAAVLGVGALWSALGLSGGLLMTIAQLGVQVVVGGVVFFAVALLLRMTEINDMIRLLLRRV